MSLTETQIDRNPPLLILTLRQKNEPETDLENRDSCSDNKKKVTWDTNVVNNEFMHKKKINCCSKCFKKKNQFLFVP